MEGKNENSTIPAFISKAAVEQKEKKERFFAEGYKFPLLCIVLGVYIRWAVCYFSEVYAF